MIKKIEKKYDMLISQKQMGPFKNIFFSLGYIFLCSINIHKVKEQHKISSKKLTFGLTFEDFCDFFFTQIRIIKERKI